jgi:ferritin-like metal-binding protein YciE
MGFHLFYIGNFNMTEDIQKILEANSVAISKLTDQVSTLVENANKAIASIPDFEKRHEALSKQVESSLEVDRESLKKLETILERLSVDTRESTTSVIKHSLISTANAKFVSGTVGLVAVLLLVWGQLSPESRKIWADKTFPVVATAGIGLIGYLLYGKVPDEVNRVIAASNPTVESVKKS